MPVRLHHIVIDAHDPPGLAGSGPGRSAGRFYPSGENEVVAGADENPPVGMCFMPVTGPKMLKKRVYL